MKIKVTKSSLKGDINVPASKSHTIRAVVAAMMADGESVIRNPLVSDDTESCLFAARKLGAGFTGGHDDGILTWKIKGTGGKLTNPNDDIINLGNSGTTLRLLTGMVATTELKVTFDGDSSLRGRLMGPLISALKKLGAKITSAEGGKCPLSVKGPISGGETVVHGKSSQFVSALLLAAPLSTSDTEITVVELNERPYVELTLDWLDKLGFEYRVEGDLDKFYIRGNQKYKPFTMTIPADFSTASFPLVAAAVPQSELTIKNLDFNDRQGDKLVFSIMEKMGLRTEKIGGDVIVSRSKDFKSIGEIDMNSIPDALPVMAVAACLAEGKTTLANAPHARIKETDRIAAMAMELKKMGAKIRELEAGLVIEGGSKLRGAVVNGHGDHRVIMSLVIAGMAASGETIVENARDFSVTYPNFIKDFKKLGANIEIL